MTIPRPDMKSAAPLRLLLPLQVRPRRDQRFQVRFQSEGKPCRPRVVPMTLLAPKSTLSLLTTNSRSENSQEAVLWR